jgi:hypothetical protein
MWTWILKTAFLVQDELVHSSLIYIHRSSIDTYDTLIQYWCVWYTDPVLIRMIHRSSINMYDTQIQYCYVWYTDPVLVRMIHRSSINTYDTQIQYWYIWYTDPVLIRMICIIMVGQCLASLDWSHIIYFQYKLYLHKNNART